MKVVATVARMAMTIKQVVAMTRVEQGAESLVILVSCGSEVGLELTSVR